MMSAGTAEFITNSGGGAHHDQMGRLGASSLAARPIEEQEASEIVLPNLDELVGPQTSIKVKEELKDDGDLDLDALSVGVLPPSAEETSEAYRLLEVKRLMEAKQREDQARSHIRGMTKLNLRELYSNAEKRGMAGFGLDDAALDLGDKQGDGEKEGVTTALSGGD